MDIETDHNVFNDLNIQPRRAQTDDTNATDVLHFCRSLREAQGSGRFAAPPDDIRFVLSERTDRISSAQFLAEPTAHLCLSPITESGHVAFLWRTIWAVRGLKCGLMPTATLIKNDTMIVCWALQTPVEMEPAFRAEEIGLLGFSEPVPLPSPNGWQLKQCAPDVRTAFDDLYVYYCGQDE